MFSIPIVPISGLLDTRGVKMVVHNIVDLPNGYNESMKDDVLKEIMREKIHYFFKDIGSWAYCYDTIHYYKDTRVKNIEYV